jgi:hypothetical protein
MNIWEVDKLIIFIAFVIPGFISIKVYDLFVPTERREIGENNKFLAPINRSKGVLVSKKDIKAVEFFK